MHLNIFYSDHMLQISLSYKQWKCLCPKFIVFSLVGEYSVAYDWSHCTKNCFQELMIHFQVRKKK